LGAIPAQLGDIRRDPARLRPRGRANQHSARAKFRRAGKNAIAASAPD